MDKILTAKTLLASLSSFKQMLAAANRGILKAATHSFGSSQTTFSAGTDLINQIYSNNTLRDTKNKLETMLDRTPEKLKKILMLRYVHNMSTRRISQMLGISQRTVFRQSKVAIANFASRLEFYNITQESYKELLKNFPRISNMQTSLQKDKEF